MTEDARNGRAPIWRDSESSGLIGTSTLTPTPDANKGDVLARAGRADATAR